MTCSTSTPTPSSATMPWPPTVVSRHAEAPAAELTLGIDPGTALMGFGLICQDKGALRCIEYGCLSTPAGMPAAERLAHLFAGLEQLIARHSPTSLAVEELF